MKLRDVPGPELLAWVRAEVLLVGGAFAVVMAGFFDLSMRSAPWLGGLGIVSAGVGVLALYEGVLALTGLLGIRKPADLRDLQDDDQGDGATGMILAIVLVALLLVFLALLLSHNPVLGCVTGRCP